MSVQITFNFTAPYEKFGVIDRNTDNLWILFHGYGQLAVDFVKPFLSMKDENTCLIVPQGLSKFYVSGSKGEVGASWMTSHDRETDIKNYLVYLNTILSNELVSSYDTLKINLFGFSQGTHTLSRWIVRENIIFHKLILWGGFFAEDIHDDDLKTHFNNSRVKVVLGDSDRFIKPDKQLLIQKKISDIIPEVQYHAFNGGHALNEDLLYSLLTSN